MSKAAMRLPSRPAGVSQVKPCNQARNDCEPCSLLQVHAEAATLACSAAVWHDVPLGRKAHYVAILLTLQVLMGPTVVPLRLPSLSLKMRPGPQHLSGPERSAYVPCRCHRPHPECSIPHAGCHSPHAGCQRPHAEFQHPHAGHPSPHAGCRC